MSGTYIEFYFDAEDLKAFLKTVVSTLLPHMKLYSTNILFNSVNLSHVHFSRPQTGEVNVEWFSRWFSEIGPLSTLGVEFNVIPRSIRNYNKTESKWGNQVYVNERIENEIDQIIKEKLGINTFVSLRFFNYVFAHHLLWFKKSRFPLEKDFIENIKFVTHVLNILMELTPAFAMVSSESFDGDWYRLGSLGVIKVDSFVRLISLVELATRTKITVPVTDKKVMLQNIADLIYKQGKHRIRVDDNGITIANEMIVKHLGWTGFIQPNPESLPSISPEDIYHDWWDRIVVPNVGASIDIIETLRNISADKHDYEKSYLFDNMLIGLHMSGCAISPDSSIVGREEELRKEYYD